MGCICSENRKNSSPEDQSNLQKLPRNHEEQAEEARLSTIMTILSNKQFKEMELEKQEFLKDFLRDPKFASVIAETPSKTQLFPDKSAFTLSKTFEKTPNLYFSFIYEHESARLPENSSEISPLASKDLIFLTKDPETIGFFTYHQAFSSKAGKHVFLKRCCHDFPLQEKPHFQCEVSLLSQLARFPDYKAEFFAKFLGFCPESQGNRAFLLFESGTMSLEQLLKLGKVFDNEEILEILRQLVRALAFLQRNGVAIRQLSPRNVVISEKTGNFCRFSYKLRDFAHCACGIRGEIPGSSVIGCFWEFAAPEVQNICNELPENLKENARFYNPFLADVFSLGLIALKMLGFKEAQELLRRGLLKDEKFRAKVPQLLEILEKMLDFDPRKRCDFLELEGILTKTPAIAGKTSEKCHKIRDKKYFELFLDFQAKEMRDSWLQNADFPEEALRKLYEFHKKLYESYVAHESLVKPAKFHLKQAWKTLENLKENVAKMRRSSVFFSAEDEDLLGNDAVEEVFCLAQLGKTNVLLGEFRKAEKFLARSSQKIEKCFGILEGDEPLLEKTEAFAGNSAKTEQGFALLAENYESLGDLYREEGNLAKSEHFFQRALRLYRRFLGEKHEKLANCYNTMGKLYFSQGNMRNAESFYQKAMRIYEELLGKTHEKTAETYENLARFYDSLGNLYKHQEFQRNNRVNTEESQGVSTTSLCVESCNLSRNIKNVFKAEELYLQALRIKQQVFGETHEKVAQTHNDLGQLYDYLGRFPEAEEFLSKALAIRTNIYGDFHEETATTYNNLGLLMVKTGSFSKAEHFYLKAIEIREEKLGEKHIETATSYNNLGLLYETTGNIPKAKGLLTKALRIFRNLVGETHGGTATSYNNLGLLCESMGNWEKAEEFHVKALRIRESLFGKTHGDTAASYNNLGALYYSLNKWSKAEENYLKALEIYEGFYGENRGDTATSYNNLAILYENMAATQKAEEFYHKALRIREAVFGETHQETAQSLKNLGLFYFHQGKIAEAEDFFARSLRVFEEIYAFVHEDVAQTLANLGEIAKFQGDFAKAEQYFLRYLKETEELRGENHKETAEACERLGNLYECDENLHEKAERFFYKTLQIRQEIFPEKSEEIMRSYANLAKLYQIMPNFSKAVEYYHSSRKLCDELFGENSKENAGNLLGLGRVYVNLQEIDKAEPLLLQAFEAFQREKDDESLKNLAICLDSLGNLYKLKGEFAKSEEKFKESLQIKEKAGVPEEIAESYYNLAEFYKETAEFGKSLEFFSATLQLQKQLLGEQHEEIAFLYREIAEIYEKTNDFAKCEESYMSVLSIQEFLCQENEEELAEIYEKLASLYKKHGFSKKAEVFYVKSVKIRKKDRKNTSRTSVSYRFLGDLYEKDMDKSRSFFETDEKIKCKSEVYTEIAENFDFNNKDTGDSNHFLNITSENIA